MQRVCLALFALGWSASLVLGQGVAVKQVTLYPTAPPSPALKYLLLPQVRDLKPGNAALLYQRAHSPEWYGELQRLPDFNKLSDWLDLPLAKFPQDKARAFPITGLVSELDLAARRESCDWELTERLRRDGVHLLLPDIQSFRSMGYVLALRTRLHILDKKYDQAVHSLQTGLAFSRHIADAPIVINGLVGIAIANTTLNQLEDLIQQPDMPNLYWAVAELPRPFIDLRRAFQGERLLVDQMFPEIRQTLGDPQKPPLAKEQIARYFANLSEIGGGKNLVKDTLENALDRIHPQAVKFLVKHGWTEEKAKALPREQTALMLAVAEYDRHYDEFYKWYTQPYWIGSPPMLQAEKNLGAAGQNVSEGAFLARAILPAVNRVAFQKARMDRRLALIQTLEALRLYAAHQEGKLPTSLEDVREVPMPLDPVTGKAFQYKLEGTKASLVAPAPAGEVANDRTEVRFEITLSTKITK